MVSARARPLEVCQLNLLRVYQLRSNLLPKFFRRHPKMTVQNDMSYVGNNESPKNCSSVKWLLIVELATTILEFTNRRYTQSAAIDIGEIETPLMSRRIVESQTQSFEMTSRSSGFEFHQVGAPIPNLSDNGCALVFSPGI
jgi:hypothetical protein